MYQVYQVKKRKESPLGVCNLHKGTSYNKVCIDYFGLQHTIAYFSSFGKRNVKFFKVEPRQ